LNFKESYINKVSISM